MNIRTSMCDRITHNTSNFLVAGTKNTAFAIRYFFSDLTRGPIVLNALISSIRENLAEYVGITCTGPMGGYVATQYQSLISRPAGHFIGVGTSLFLSGRITRVAYRSITNAQSLSEAMKRTVLAGACVGFTLVYIPPALEELSDLTGMAMAPMLGDLSASIIGGFAAMALCGTSEELIPSNGRRWFDSYAIKSIQTALAWTIYDFVSPINQTSTLSYVRDSIKGLVFCSIVYNAADIHRIYKSLREGAILDQTLPGRFPVRLAQYVSLYPPIKSTVIKINIINSTAALGIFNIVKKVLPQENITQAGIKLALSKAISTTDLTDYLIKLIEDEIQDKTRDYLVENTQIARETLVKIALKGLSTYFRKITGSHAIRDAELSIYHLAGKRKEILNNDIVRHQKVIKTATIFSKMKIDRVYNFKSISENITKQLFEQLDVIERKLLRFNLRSKSMDEAFTLILEAHLPGMLEEICHQAVVDLTGQAGPLTEAEERLLYKAGINHIAHHYMAATSGVMAPIWGIANGVVQDSNLTLVR